MRKAKAWLRDAVVLCCSGVLAHACSVERKSGQASSGGTAGASNGGSSGKQSETGGNANSVSGGKGTAGASASGGTSSQGGALGTGGDMPDALAGAGGESGGGAGGALGGGGTAIAGGVSTSSGGTATAGGVSTSSGGATTATGGSAPTSGGTATSSGGATSTACASNPCLNSGSCSPTSGGYSCTCSTRFVGTRCEFQRFMASPITIAALSQDGTTVAGTSCPTSGDCSLAKMSTATGAVTLLTLPTSLPSGVTLSNICDATAINADGSWIGARCTSNAGNGFASVEWPKSATSGAYVAGRNSGEAIAAIGGVSSDASIIAGTLVAFTSTTTGVNQIFRRTTSTGVVVLPPLNSGEWAGVYAVSNDGLLLVGSSGGHPFRWHPSAGMQALAEIPNAGPNQDQGYVPHDVSADGNVIVGAFATRGGPTALRWTSSGVQSMGLGEALGTNKDGSLVVGSTTTGACAWDSAGTAKSVLDVIGSTSDTTGWQLSSAIAVSDDGKVVVGTGIKDAKYQSWVAHLP